jgi:aminoglycoside phosphotransferase (APT) family kinase protein
LRDLPVSRAVLAQVGRMHARLHALPVGNATGWARNDPSQQFETARTQLDWIGLMQPQHRDAVRTLSTRLHRLPTWQEDAARFCHGDLVCSQFLVQGLTGRGHQGGQAGAPASAGPVSTDPADWAITDFDLCHVGDPCRDLAILLASLAYDLPGMAELDRREPARVAHWVAEVSQAYLQAYAEESGAALPADRLVWQGLCAEIHYLALMLKKDRFQPLAFERRLQHALALCGARNWA